MKKNHFYVHIYVDTTYLYFTVCCTWPIVSAAKNGEDWWWTVTNYEIRIGDERWRINLKQEDVALVRIQRSKKASVASKHRSVERENVIVVCSGIYHLAQLELARYAIAQTHAEKQINFTINMIHWKYTENIVIYVLNDSICSISKLDDKQLYMCVDTLLDRQ